MKGRFLSSNQDSFSVHDWLITGSSDGATLVKAEKGVWV
jgi:hypothetical protein